MGYAVAGGFLLWILALCQATIWSHHKVTRGLIEDD